MIQDRIIFLTEKNWSIRLDGQRCLCACLAGMILFISGCAKVAVPNVEGSAQDVATTAINGAKLKVGSITQQSNNMAVAGIVISQDPPNGTSVAEGSLVNLVVSSGPQMMAVPNMAGLTQEAATAAINGAKLKVRSITQQSNNTVVAGKVVSQDPPSGTSVREGSLVNLVVSSGPQMMAVPNMEGLTQDAATVAIIGVKLKVGTIIQQTSNTMAAGKVISQNPASGSSMAEGSPVNLVVSSGPQMVAVPNVEGLTQDTATTEIAGTKLKVGTITQQTSNTVATGKVVGQDPASGSSMAEGSAVNLVISSGPQMVTVPDVGRLTQDDATTAITATKLTVGTVAQEASSTVPTGCVISQDPASGNSLTQGSPVNLMISSGPQVMVTVPSVEGLTQAAATTAITGAKLMAGTVTQQPSSTVVAGNVISQDPANGSSLAQGSPMNLVISSGPQIATVANVEGLTQDAATAAIVDAKLKVGSVTQQTSNTVATGKVISQDPASGSSVAEGSPVNLVVSSGPQMAAVPDLTGLTQDAATAAIADAKLKVGSVTQQTSNTVATDKVISQDPASGSSLAEGSPVKLLISSGPQMAAVPNVEGLSQAAATTGITGAKLKVGTVTQQTSNMVAIGSVISQDPASGSSLAEGSLVNLVISLGPQMVTVPNLEGLTQAAATAAISRAKLTVGTVVATGKVISQDPASGSSVAQGSSVNLVISLGPQRVTVPNVEGLTEAAAAAAVTASNLTVGTITQQASNTVPAGNVVSQDQPSGSSVAQGSPVNLVISSGPQMAAVPNVEGMTQAAATTSIATAKLTVGTITQQSSNSVAAGSVISQDPASGNSVVQGSPINLVISE